MVRASTCAALVMLVVGTASAYLAGRANAGSPELNATATTSGAPDTAQAPQLPAAEPNTAAQSRSLTSTIPHSAESAPGSSATGRLDPDDTLRREYPLHGVASHWLAQVFSEPSERGVVSGYLRRGSSLRLKSGVRGKGCDSLWHAVFGGGYVCADRGFLLGEEPQTFPAAAPPTLYEALPYRYAKAVTPDAAVYLRPPTPDEERDVSGRLTMARKLGIEPVLAAQLARIVPAARSRHSPRPAARSAHAQALLVPDIVRMLLQPGFYVSSDGAEAPATTELAFTRTVRGEFVRHGAEHWVTPSTLQGVTLASAPRGPLALIARANAASYTRDVLTGELAQQGSFRQLEAVELGDEVIVRGRRSYRVLLDGRIAAEDVLRLIPTTERPKLVPRQGRWIAVTLSSQTLVAYEGTTPVFATLVSTGKIGYETQPGIFRIQSKHVSATMDGEAGSDEAYSIEDVPWVMYFSGSIALHAAFWHERFGRQRSHGCVNLAPLDARWLFDWAGPRLPVGFHGVIATRQEPGTFVLVAP